MLVKLDNPPSTPSSKPQLHTLKNHDDYNGLLHPPQTTHVRVDRHHYTPRDDNTHTLTPTTRTTYRQRRRYLITLHYPHNRACTISRSHADVLTLTRRLAVAATALLKSPGPEGKEEATMTTTPSRRRPKRDGDCSSSGSSNNSKPTQPLPLTCPPTCPSSCPASRPSSCSCSCSCPCPCSPHRGSERRLADARAAGELNSLLGEALRKVREE